MPRYVETQPSDLRRRVAVELARLACEDLRIAQPPQLKWFAEGREGATVWEPGGHYHGWSDGQAVWLDAAVKDAYTLARTVGHELAHAKWRHQRFALGEGGTDPILEHDAERYASEFARFNTALAIRKARIPPRVCRQMHGMIVALVFEPLAGAVQSRVSSSSTRRLPDRLLRSVERAAEAVRGAIGFLEALRGQAEAPERYESRSGDPRCGYYGKPY
jgi:hypothetical protein